MAQGIYRQIFKWQSFELSYLKIGSGHKQALAFHGFGKSAEDFLFLEKSLGDKYTLYAIDIFFHGKSVFPINRVEKRPLDKQELLLLMQHFFSHVGIQSFSLIGYSLGGKFSLVISELFSMRVEKLVLIAPDGLLKNRFQEFATKTGVGIWVSGFILKQAGLFLSLLKLAKRFHWIHEKTYRFVYLHMETHEKRLLVYRVWLAMRKIEVDKELLVYHLSTDVSCHCILGKYDSIIPPAPIRQFFSACKNCEIIEIDEGHDLLKKSLLPVLEGVMG